MTTSVLANTCHNTAEPLVVGSPPTAAMPVEPDALLGSMAALGLTANLSCEIHPILACKYWIAISDGEFEQLKPALRLTTMLMNTPASLGFFATLLFGDRAMDEVVSKEGKKKFRGHITKEAHLTPFKAERVRDMFSELEGIFQFTCQIIEEESWAVAETYACTDLTEEEYSDLEWRHHIEKPAAWSPRMSLKHNMTVDRTEGEEKEFCWPEPQGSTYNPYDGKDEKPLQDPRTRMTPSIIVLSTQLLLCLRARCHSTENTLRSNFVVAVCLIHELAHAVEFGRPECREWDVDEAIFSGEETPELGWQAELHIFAGGTFGDWQADEWLQFKQATDGGKQAYAIPLDYLARIQQQVFWDSVSSTDITSMELVHLPKTIPLPD